MTSTITVLAEHEAASYLLGDLTLRSDVSCENPRRHERLFGAPAAAPELFSARAVAAASDQQTWDEGISAFAASVAKRPEMRAFRGLQAWRDPA